MVTMIRGEEGMSGTRGGRCFTHQEEERNCCRGGGLVVLADAQQNGDHHHAEGQTSGTNDHGPASSHAVKGKSRKRIAHNEHQFDKPSDQLSFMARYLNVGDQDAGHVY